MTAIRNPNPEPRTPSPRTPSTLERRLADLTRDAEVLTRQARIMEVCGTHTVALRRMGLHSLLPANVKLISGPGCPVCVTPTNYIDDLLALARKDGVIIATYGDMIRVPGSEGSLAEVRARGADVRVVGSALRAFQLAHEHPDRDVIFAAVGFETTTPATADIVLRAHREGMKNLFVLCAHKLLIPAMNALLTNPRCAIDGFLCPGHVSVMIGSEAYEPVVSRFKRPCVVAGFEPLQMVEAVARIVAQLRRGEAKVENVYTAAVRPERHAVAWKMIEEVFTPDATEWRALGSIPGSGLRLKDEYRRFDAAERFGVQRAPSIEPRGCRCGEVILGVIDPPECGLFGKRCTPDSPVGPCMVSSEGACQAWYAYGSTP
jgi:hydrogenase expression/formation protein HypD